MASRRGGRVQVPNNPGIYKRNGAYSVRVYIPSTKRTREISGISSLAEAKRIKREEEDRKHKRGNGHDETVAGWAARWLKEFPRKEKTTEIHHTERVRKFVKDFGDAKLREITRAEAHTWALEHRSNVQSVQAMFSDAKRIDLIEDNPFNGLRLPESRGRKDIVALTREDVRRLAQCAVQKWGEFGERQFGPQITVAAWTGMRPGEIYALHWEDVDLDAQEVRVWRAFKSRTGEVGDTKNAQSRRVVLLPEARDALDRVERVNDGGPIFRTMRGARFSQRVTHYYWDPVRALFGRPDLEFYELRHFFGTELANRGVSPYDIAQQMGHQDGGKLAMERYIHVASSEAKDRILRAYGA